MDERQLIGHAILQDWLELAFKSAGMTADEARATASVLAYADLRGVYSHGSVRVMQYINLIRRRRWRSGTKPRLIAQAGALTLFDGRHGVGPFVALTAMTETIRVARQYGAGWTWVRNAGHFGPASFFATEATKAGMMGLVFTNSSAAMAAWGGRRAVIGANPWSIAAPHESGGWPIVLDMANTSVARGRVRAAAERHERIPTHWGIDALGQPSVDPAAVLAGSLRPFGEYKGYAIAFLIEVISGIVSGAGVALEVRGPDESAHGYQRVGQAFAAIDVSRVVPLSELSERLDQLIKYMRSSDHNIESEILVPGEKEARTAAYQLQEGIQLPVEAWKALNRAADLLGIGQPSRL